MTDTNTPTSTAINEEKKNEKLNLRISEHEKSIMTSAAKASGFENISGWARKVLVSNANVFDHDRERADLVIALTGHSLQISSQHVEKTISITNAIAHSTQAGRLVGVGEDALKNQHGFTRPVFEGHIKNLDQFKILLQTAFYEFSEKYAFSGANVLVAARTTHSVKQGLKKAISSIIPCNECFLIEYSMACAVGIDIPVVEAKHPAQPLLCIENDWLEVATIHYGGAHASQSMSIGFDQILEEKNEDISISMKRIAAFLTKHLDGLKDFPTTIADPILTGQNEEALKHLQKYLKIEQDLSCTIKLSNDAAAKGSLKVLPELLKLMPIIQSQTPPSR